MASTMNTFAPKDQPNRIDTSNFDKKKKAKYEKDENGDVLQRKCVVDDNWFLVKRYQKDRVTCCGKCTLCYEHGGSNYDYEIAKKWKYERMHEGYKKKTGYDNPGQNPEVRKKVQETLDERYGDGTEGSGYKTRMKQALKAYQEKTGYINPGQSPEVRAKVNKTLADNYGDGDLDKANKEVYKRRAQQYKAKTGYINPSQNPEVREKVKKTVNERYGVDNVFQSEEIKDKIARTNLERYGFRCSMQNKDIQRKSMETVQAKYGVPYRIMAEDARKSSGAISKTNKKYAEELKELLNVPVELEKQFDYDKHKSADLYVSSADLYIELNPTISHNSTLGYRCFKGLCHKENHSKCGKATDYHSSRAMEARSHDIKLVQFYDWDDSDRRTNYIKNLVEDNHVDNGKIVVTVEEVTDEIQDFFTNNDIHSSLVRAWNLNDECLVMRDLESNEIKAACDIEKNQDNEISLKRFVTLNQKSLTINEDLLKEIKGVLKCKTLHLFVDLDLNLPTVIVSSKSQKIAPRLIWAAPKHNGNNSLTVEDASIKLELKTSAIQKLKEDGHTEIYTAGLEDITL